MIPLLLQIGSFSSAETALLPLVIVAMLLDSAIVSVWYALGVILNNQQVKSSAITEFYQVGGTALLTALLTGLLITFSTSFYGIMSTTQLLNPTAVSTICQGIMKANTGTGLGILGPNGGVLSGPSSSAKTVFTGFCNMVDPKNLQSPTSGSPPVTALIDYPLAVTGVINANVTSQLAANLNSAFVFDSFVGFLQTFSPSIGICIASVPPAFTCLPGWSFAAATPSVNLDVAFAPYAGYNFLYISLTPFGTMLTNAFTVLVGVLVADMVLVVAWPYLIFVGLILRSTPFTRSVGGFIIALAIGIVVFYPLAYSMEYLALGGGLAGSSVIASGKQACADNYGTCSSACGTPTTPGYGACTDSCTSQLSLCTGAAESGTGPNIYGYNSITTIPGSTLTCPGDPAGSLPSCSGSATDMPYCSDDYKPACTGGDTPKCPSPPPPNGMLGPLQPPAPSCNYTVNFFVQPNLQKVTEHYGCWPTVFGAPGPLIGAELEDIESMMVPLWSAYGFTVSLISNGQQPSLPKMDLPSDCPVGGAYNTFSAFLQSFGLIGVSTYLLPIINLIITVSGVLGVSGMLGGDTSLAGLSKFL
jgi:hypothetical protein